ncbi:hypothetical protein [Flammeovirga kamogawensis]|uniref:Uncharacterized protein n=1 Tax=Flammeovirga kamogawensis TaxID=373891 RepID=A0ABX8H195_9BACT|nr:hypothetical protein [Flammeovirga kamogawensis]MBB6459531.1 hypothetical protein [Flammeovirga kamogawensis]QWG09082.1 hypothetical protein KM029_09090 [Flammeovirga kamogawensis]TRX67370.1 hypothetical protein EO216_04130 [Flammeovirga kamogawensis]
MERITTYANINSLTSFFTKRPSLEDELDDMDWSRSWMDFYSFLNKQADLRLDVDPTQLSMMSKTNPYIKKMLKNASSGGSSLRCEKEAFDQLDVVSKTTMPQTMFFLDKSNQECEDIETKYGIITLNPNRIKSKAGFMFNWSLYNVTKDRGAVKRFEKWSQLERFRHPHNSMVIIDNYLLKDLGEMEENLIPMLDALMPEKLEVTFQLTLISVDLRDKPASMKKYIEWELKNKLKRPYNIEVCVIKTESNKNHDRNIFTNYLWMHSGHSFTYLRRQQISKNTNLMLFPIFYQQKDFQSYYDEIPGSTESKSSVWGAVNQRLREARYIIKTASNDYNGIGGELKNSILVGNKTA